jgi:hypothetical protein
MLISIVLSNYCYSQCEYLGMNKNAIRDTYGSEYSFKDDDDQLTVTYTSRKDIGVERYIFTDNKSTSCYRIVYRKEDAIDLINYYNREFYTNKESWYKLETHFGYSSALRVDLLIMSSTEYIFYHRPVAEIPLD